MNPRPDRPQASRGGAVRARIVEPWFVAYAVVGAVAVGLMPILLPLWADRSGDGAHIGLVVAALALGQLSSPLWGGLADRWRWHRPVFGTGLLLAGGSLVAMTLEPGAAMIVATAFALGVGVAATTTVANLFIVERYPRAQWGVRLGALQTVYGVGQVAGLVLAGALGVADLRIAMALAAALPFAALLFVGALPTMPGSAPAQRPSLARLHVNVEPLFASLVHGYRLATWHRVIGGLRSAPGEFLHFLGLWYVLNVGAALIFAFYPLLMADAYGVGAGVASIGFAAAAAVGLLLYTPAGRWIGRVGSGRVLQTGILVRVATFAGLGLLAFAPASVRAPGALLLFAVTVLAWPLLGVAGTTMAASSRWSEGEAVGAFSAVGAAAGVSGALLGGLLVRTAGYAALPLVACALMVAAAWMSRWSRPAGSRAPRSDAVAHDGAAPPLTPHGHGRDDRDHQQDRDAEHDPQVGVGERG